MSERQALGEFFVNDSCETKKELNLGETPLSFSACTNQKQLFDVLLARAR